MNAKMKWVLTLTTTASLGLAGVDKAQAQYRPRQNPNQAQVQQQEQQILNGINTILFGQQQPNAPRLPAPSNGSNASANRNNIGGDGSMPSTRSYAAPMAPGNSANRNNMADSGMSYTNPYGNNPNPYANQPQQGYIQQTQQPYYQPQQNGYQNQYVTNQPTQNYSTASNGQRFQIPGGYANTPGAVINYGGASYQVGNDGTMSPYGGVQQSSYQPAQTQSTTQRYQIPAGYEGSSAGSVINYGGSNYQVGGDGTMTMTSATTSTASQPTTNQRYQVPGEYAGTAAGYIINYGGINYLTAGDGTMTAY